MYTYERCPSGGGPAPRDTVNVPAVWCVSVVACCRGRLLSVRGRVPVDVANRPAVRRPITLAAGVCATLPTHTRTTPSVLRMAKRYESESESPSKEI